MSRPHKKVKDDRLYVFPLVDSDNKFLGRIVVTTEFRHRESWDHLNEKNEERAKERNLPIPAGPHNRQTVWEPVLDGLTKPKAYIENNTWPGDPVPEPRETLKEIVEHLNANTGFRAKNMIGGQIRKPINDSETKFHIKYLDDNFEELFYQWANIEHGLQKSPNPEHQGQEKLTFKKAQAEE